MAGNLREYGRKKNRVKWTRSIFTTRAPSKLYGIITYYITVRTSLEP